MDYSDVAGFGAGAIGEPGARTFLLQFTGPWGVHTYLLEKGQVAALVSGTDQLIKEVGRSPKAGTIAPGLLDEVPRFRISQLGLGFDEGDESVLITIESVSESDESVTYKMDLEQLSAAAKQGAAAVVGGRPPCPRCGLAMDPDGHACPTTNGDLRNHQP